MAKTCRTEGCGKNAHEGGLCTSCVRAEQNNRAIREAFDLHYVEIGYPATCAGPNCSAPSRVRGFCRTHYRLWKAACIANGSLIETTITSVPSRPKWEYEGDEDALIEPQEGNEHE